MPETIEGKYGIVGMIHQDEDPWYADPRDNDNLGVMYCWHPDYKLGDEQFGRNDHGTIEDVFTYVVEERKAVAVIPLFLLDHSGISMRTGTPIDVSNGLSPEAVAARDRFIGDEAGWDTSWVGFIFATQARKDELGVPDGVEEVERQLDAEVREYDTYLRGEVYSFVVKDADGDDYDHPVGGFLGYEYVEEEVKSVIESAEHAHEREISERQFWLEREVVTVG